MGFAKGAMWDISLLLCQSSSRAESLDGECGRGEMESGDNGIGREACLESSMTVSWPRSLLDRVKGIGITGLAKGAMCDSSLCVSQLLSSCALSAHGVYWTGEAGWGDKGAGGPTDLASRIRVSWPRSLLKRVNGIGATGLARGDICDISLCV